MNYTSNTTTGENFIYEDMNNHSNNVGWICPKCGRSVSPELKTCPYCSTVQSNEGLNPGEQLICS